MPRAHGGDVSESELHGMAPTRMMGLPERAKLAEAWRALQGVIVVHTYRVEKHPV